MKSLSVWALGLFSGLAWGVDLGALDTSFAADGQTDGYVLDHEPGFNRYGAAVVVDSQQRIYVAGTFDYDFAGQTEKGARVERWLPNGQRDTSFAGNGVVELVLPPAPGNQFNYGLAVDPADGVFVGYSRLFCVTSNNCQSQLYVYHINASGATVGNQQVSFDLGATDDRKDDDFADFVYEPLINKLAIAATVERSGAQDTDMGIAVLNVDPVSGALSIDNGFDADGKNQCWFDQADPAGSEDRAAAVIYHPLNQTFVVGGSAFEGNGLQNDGWNMAFCEFSLSGTLLRQWSTQSTQVVLESQEFVADMAYSFDFIRGSGLLVAGTVNGAGGMDYAVTRYQQDQADQWNTDTGYGDNGFRTVGFQYLFVGETSDYVSQMQLEDDGRVLLVGSLTWEDNNQQAHSAIGLTRITPSGQLDRTWGIGRSGKAVHSFDLISLWDHADALAVDPVSEELYVSGWSYNGDFQSLLVNLHNDQIFAANMETD
jgi:hypothetical protein